jgi:hypothetical protein
MDAAQVARSGVIWRAQNGSHVRLGCDLTAQQRKQLAIERIARTQGPYTGSSDTSRWYTPRSSRCS